MGNPRKVIAMVEVTDDVDLMGTEGREEQKGIEKQIVVEFYEWRISKREKGEGVGSKIRVLQA